MPGNTVATLTIKANQDNFRSNGRYFVRVTSKDAAGVTSAPVPIMLYVIDSNL